MNETTQLNNVHSKVINEAYLIYEALATLETADIDQEREAKHQLIEYVQNIKALATTAHLRGLQEVCTITEQQWLELESRDANHRPVLYAEIERWPRLISNYLYTPTDEDQANELVTYLQNTPWQQPLSAEHAQHLFLTLIKDSTTTNLKESLPNPQATLAALAADEIHDEGTSKIELESPETTIISYDDNKIITTDQIDDQSLQPEKMVAWAKHQEEEDELDEPSILSQTIASEQQLSLAGENYQDFSTFETLENGNLKDDYEPLPLTPTTSWSDAELEKILDETVFETLPLVETPEDSLEGLPGTESAESLSDESLEPPEEDNSEAFSFVTDLLLDDDAQTLLEDLEATPTNNDPTSLSSGVSAREPPTAPATKIQHSKSLTDLSNRVVELSDLLSFTLNQWVTAEEDSEIFLEAIERYTNAIYSLWEAAGKLNLKGFQEVCTFVNDNVFEASALPSAKKLEIRDLFAHWPKMLLDYLQSATKGATLLIEHLSAPAWPLSLPSHQANSLLVQLVQDAVMPQITEIEGEHPALPHKITQAEPSRESKNKDRRTEQTSEIKPGVPSSLVAPKTSSPEVPPTRPFADEETAIDRLPVSMPDWGQAFIDENVLLASDQHEENMLWVPEWQAEATNMAHHKTASPGQKKIEPSTNYQADSQLLPSTEDEDENEVIVWTPDARRPTSERPTHSLSFPPLEDDLLSALGAADEREDELLPELFDEMFEDQQTLPTLGEDYLLAEEPTTFKGATEADTLATQRPLADTDTLGSAFELTEEDASLSHDETTSMVSATLPHEFHLASPHVIDLLKVEISEAQRDLSKALNKFAVAEDDSAEMLEAIEQYNDNVQSIAEAAKKTGLKGLQDVCTFVNENMFELSTHARIIRRTAQSHLDTWPRLVLAYLQSPLTGAQDLVAHLRNPVWPYALDEAHSRVMLALLTRGVLGIEEETILIVSDEPPLPVTRDQEKEPEAPQPFGKHHERQFEKAVSEDKPLTKKPALEAIVTTPEKVTARESSEPQTAMVAKPIVVEKQIAPDISNLLIEQLTDIEENLSVALASIYHADEGRDELLTSVETYTENVQALWEAAEMAKLGELQEVCTFINENVMALSGQDKTTRIASQSVLTTWLPKVIAYLRQPQQEITKLISHLQDTHWPIPLSVAQTATLQQHLRASTPPLAITADLDSPADPAEVFLANPEILEVVIGQIVDLEDSLRETLNRLCEAKDGSEDLLTVASTYTEHVQAIWDAAEMAKLEGLQEVCTFINDNVMALGGLDKAARRLARELFATWPQLTLAYLRQPAQATATLLQHLQNAKWPIPLDDTQAEALHQHLLPRLLSVLFQEEPDSSKGVELPSTPAEATPAIILASPDVLELVSGQLMDLEEPLLETLNSLCEAADGSEDLLTVASTYTEHVQALWEAAEMAKLGGLQEVCTFINDNVMALGGQDKSARRVAYELFAAWPQLTRAYLRQPAQEALTLLQHLQNAKWPTPLDEAQAETLQQHLLPRQTPDSAPSDILPRPAQPTIYLAAPDILELVRSQIIECQEGMSAALEVCMSMESGNPAFLEAIENYTNQVQAIWEAADMAGLAGLQEVCTFINENLMAFGTQEPSARRAAQPYLEKWPAAVLAYLQSPLPGAQSLVQMMQASAWPTPLEADRANQFLTLLTRSSSSPAQVAAYESEVVADTNSIEAEEAEAEVATPPEEIGMEVTQEISLGSAEVLGILTEELQSAKEPLTTELKRFTTLANSDATFTEAAENYADQIQRLNAAAEMLGLQGLQNVCAFLVDNVKLLSKQDQTARNKAKKVLEAWPDFVLAYLNSPMTSVIPMLNHLRESAWAKPLPDEQAHDLLSLLTQGSTGEDTIDQEPAYSRPTQAHPEDVSLKIPGDVNRELLAAYLQEVPQNASEFSGLIQSIIRDPQQTGVVEHAKRIAHTLKGSSNIIGIKGLATISHHLEDTLEYIAQHKVVPPKELTDTMVEAADCIELMVDALLGQDEAPPQAQQVLQSVLDWANRIDRGNLQAPPASSRPAPATAPPKGDAKATQKPDTDEKKAESAPAAGEVATGTPEQVLRVPTKTVDNLMRLVGELSISLGQIQEKMKHVLQSTRVLTEQDLILQRKTFALENLVDVRGVTGVMTSNYSRTSDDEDGFDPLEFEEYNELHSVAHSFIESIADNRELAMSIRNDLAELETMFIHQQRLNKEFEASVMTTRMVPVNTILSKLQRNVRQTCRMTGKQAELELSGTDILIDSDVLNSLGDPLQHVLRNAIDHGIEAADERVLLGKPASGHIHLSFYREGNNVVVKCQDDGQGLNYTNIRYTAIQRGLLKDGQEVSEAELGRFILMSGFSTKSGVTQVSGRGVGMDVVHTNIRQMKGTLDLASQTGKGMTLVIKLPMTLVTLHVLLVRIGHRTFGIPTNNLEQVLAPGVGEYQRVGGEITFKMGKHFYPIKSLALLLHEPGDRAAVEEDDPRPVVLVHEETGVMAVVVDELLDTHDLVMKSMGEFVKHIHGVAGAAILGDGSVVPLLDLPELLRSPMQAVMSSMMAEQPGGGTGILVPSGVPNIMIVDDSLSVRKSLSLLVEDAGFETMLAKDGLEAIELMNQKRPNVMLVDMEMPRMNGLELTAHVRANQATQTLPIFMITSRTTEKHREQAKTAGVNAYLTKPYQDTELLGLIDKALAGQV